MKSLRATIETAGVKNGSERPTSRLSESSLKGLSTKVCCPATTAITICRFEELIETDPTCLQGMARRYNTHEFVGEDCFAFERMVCPDTGNRNDGIQTTAEDVFKASFMPRPYFDGRQRGGSGNPPNEFWQHDQARMVCHRDLETLLTIGRIEAFSLKDSPSSFASTVCRSRSSHSPRAVRLYSLPLRRNKSSPRASLSRSRLRLITGWLTKQRLAAFVPWAFFEQDGEMIHHVHLKSSHIRIAHRSSEGCWSASRVAHVLLRSAG
jgi:hypothetical protein